jgi:hypothetical protein
MYIDHNFTEEYPFTCVFYQLGIDDSKPLDQQVEEEIPVFNTVCDMTSGSSLSTDTFTLFFPFNSETETLKIKEGLLFKGNIYGMEQRGRVIGVYPSQLGGCTVLCTRV